MADPPITDEIMAALPRLRSYARALAGAQDGEDLAQATIERAISRAHLYQPGTRVHSWLFRIAHNLHVNNVRAARNREQTTAPEDMVSLGPTTSGQADAALLLSRVSAAIDELPADQRAALAVIAIEGKSYSEAAEELGLERGTLASRVARARQALSRVINGD